VCLRAHGLCVRVYVCMLMRVRARAAVSYEHHGVLMLLTSLAGTPPKQTGMLP